MINYFEPVDFDKTVYIVTDDRKIESHTLGELCRQYADTTIVPKEGLVPRTHIHNDTELWVWGEGGRARKRAYAFQTKEEAEHGLLLNWRWDLTDPNADNPQIFDSHAEAESYIEDYLCDLADELLLETQAKGVCTIRGTVVWLFSAEYMQAEQKGWDENDAGRYINFAASKFWLSASDGVIKAVSGPKALIPYLR